MIRVGNLRGDKVVYEDGTGCCVWYPMGEGEDEDTGLCFDFSYKDIDDLIELLNQLKTVEAKNESSGSL